MSKPTNDPANGAPANGAPDGGAPDGGVPDTSSPARSTKENLLAWREGIAALLHETAAAVLKNPSNADAVNRLNAAQALKASGQVPPAGHPAWAYLPG